ncbi:MATE family efflux transporter [Neptunicella sp. SCSIO 80796]|uniref:MATE family efflux transporter n=1 Tax=Neptunicella plasticusilytica TaxID=3117012 RepID=UPI003A4E3E46
MKKHWFWNKTEHLKIALISGPMLLSNITQPLLGMVDTAIVGHMDAVDFLAGVAIGAMLITQLYWLSGALRMSTTGLSAQAKGQGSVENATKTLLQSLLLALVIATLLFLGRNWLLQVAIYFTQPAANVASIAREYFYIRVWGAPAALSSLVLVGWLLGQQYARFVMLVQIGGNTLNVLLNFLLVYGLDMGVEGVALATVIAEYTMCLAMFHHSLKKIDLSYLIPDWFKMSHLSSLFSVNSAMFIRNLALQLCMAFIVVQGARWGEMTIAINSLLHQFFVLCALGLDAIAYSAEALTGESKGARKPAQIISRTYLGLSWSVLLSMLYCAVYMLFGGMIIDVMTDIPQLQQQAREFLPYIWVLPLVGHWCFLMDGVYVGLGRAKAMRDSMLVSAIVGFFPVFYLLKFLGNHALWIALLSFLTLRGLTLMIHFNYLQKKAVLLD